jgi:ferrochelatase
MADKVGILLVNLGTPEATSYWPMRKYLKEFLSDPRVIEAKGPVWWLIFNGIILTRRPKKSGQAYAKIWNTELDESPLKTITRSQAEKLAVYYENNVNIQVDWAMRYGNPAIADKIDKLVATGCEQILVFPLYPQYSAATTASVMDKVFDTLKSMRHQPTIRSVPPYYDHTSYIKTLADSIRKHHATLNWAPEVIIASLHGLPQSFIDKGDPYQQQCEKTVALLRDALGLNEKQLILTYQSRSGRTEWMHPDTEDTLTSLASNGVKNVTIVTPGFASDCVETLEEINMRAADIFLHAGGLNFSPVPCLNDSSSSIKMLYAITNANIFGNCSQTKAK